MRDECDFSKGKRGPVIPRDPSKVRITIRLDADIVDYFKSPIERKSRMPQIRGIKGEVVVVYCEPLITKEMGYYRLSRRGNKMGFYKYFISH